MKNKCTIKGPVFSRWQEKLSELEPLLGTIEDFQGREDMEFREFVLKELDRLSFIKKNRDDIIMNEALE